MGQPRAWTLALLGATAACLGLIGCGYPDYSGFDKPRGESDAAGLDAQDEAAPDVVEETAEAADADAGPDVGDDAPDAPDVDAAEEADAAEAETAWCTSNTDCEHDPAGPLCDLTTGRCGACLPTDDVCPPGQYCSASTLRCELGCKGDSDCVVAGPDGGKDEGGVIDPDADTDAGADGGEVEAGQDAADPKVLTCDPTSHACTGCDVDNDCPAGTICEAPTCVPGCTMDHPCPSGRDCCGGVCMDTSNDPEHCGNCDTVCSDPSNAQAACVSSACVIANCLEPYADCDGDYQTGCETDISTSLQHCGGCGVACSLLNADAQCVSGFCGIQACHVGFDDCDLDPSNGCEIQTLSDEANCGVCDHACNLLPHAVTACIGASCEVGSCDDGYADCNSSASDGCETSTLGNVNHCGGCGAACSLLHANPSCSGGICGVASCITPYANCDGLVGNGCEVDVTVDPQHCGTCTNTCTYDHAAGLCTNGSCSLGACAAGYGNCNQQPGDGCESALGMDVTNCGSCGHACSAPHTVPGCSGGSCEIATCSTPWGDCNTSFADGCETDLSVSAANCGVCGKVCSYPNAAALCATGTCQLGGCNQGFANCDADPSNGCEVNTQSSIQHCGGCGNACNTTNGIASCAGAQCAIACNSGFSDCNHSAVDGCETAINNNVTDCGACGNVCSVAHGTPTCNGTSCQVASCTSQWGDCNGTYGDGCETPLTTTTDCGLCGNPCAPANAMGTCATGTCGIVSCNPGYEDCDGNPSNGCEVNTNSDVNHCGSCPNKCPTSCTPKCTSGTCGCSTCPTPGTADCDNDPGNGCETTTTGDPSNCGGCGAVCTAPNGTAGCANSLCTVSSCDSGWGNCNGLASDGCEVNLRTLTDCGSCNTACDLAHATEACTTGTCAITACDPGWGNCDANPANGCETSTGTSPMNCGTCGTICNSTNGTATCNSGACGIICAAGFADCDGNLTNGCETSIVTSAGNCGGCGNVCDSTNGTPSCASGLCAIACNPGWGNCDANASNGCETSTTANISNCGACSNVCSSINGTASCAAGACSIACNGGFGDCDSNVANGCEANLQSDPLHCSTCAIACNLPHAVNACVGGTCSIGSCLTGWTDCDATPSTGCEVNTGTGVTNCGACGNVCNSTNGTATCASGVCGITCAAGFANCDGNPANGCEISTATNVNNCATCGHVCPAISHGTAACTASVCGVGTCDPGYHESAGACVPDGELCSNGVDDEGDGRIDCFDTDCLTDPACSGRCMDAASIGCDTWALLQNTGASGATQRIAPPSYSCTATTFAGPEYAYKLTGAAAGQNVFVEAYGLGGDVGLMAIDVATGAQCNATTSCSKAGNLYTSTNPEAIGFTTVTGRDYYIVVDAASAQAYSLSVQCSTTGGCFAAKAIQSGQSITTTNATTQINGTNNALNSYSCYSLSETGPEAAFIFTPTASRNYTISLTGLNADCDLFVVNQNNCNGTCYNSSSYSVESGTTSEEVILTATANKSYFIVVDGYSGNTCNFTLSIN